MCDYCNTWFVTYTQLYIFSSMFYSNYMADFLDFN